MKKKILFNPKPLSKAERAYMQALANRPRQTPFTEMFSKVNNSLEMKGDLK